MTEDKFKVRYKGVVDEKAKWNPDYFLGTFGDYAGLMTAEKDEDIIPIIFEKDSAERILPEKDKYDFPSMKKSLLIDSQDAFFKYGRNNLENILNEVSSKGIPISEDRKIPGLGDIVYDYAISDLVGNDDYNKIIKAVKEAREEKKKYEENPEKYIEEVILGGRPEWQKHMLFSSARNQKIVIDTYVSDPEKKARAMIGEYGERRFAQDTIKSFDLSIKEFKEKSEQIEEEKNKNLESIDAKMEKDLESVGGMIAPESELEKAREKYKPDIEKIMSDYTEAKKKLIETSGRAVSVAPDMVLTLETAAYHTMSLKRELKKKKEEAKKKSG